MRKLGRLSPASMRTYALAGCLKTESDRIFFYSQMMQKKAGCRFPRDHAPVAHL
jgi:hypothetical protein